MTVVCDKCGQRYFVAGVISRSGELVEPSCPHCGQTLWSNEPSPATRREPGLRAPTTRTRGFS